MKTACTILLVLTALAAGAQTSTPGQPITAVIDASKTGPPISPYVYGPFLEHIGNLIYSGLWSEMLEGRTFYYAVASEPEGDSNSGRRGFGGGRGRGAGPGWWNPIGPVDSTLGSLTLPRFSAIIHELPVR